MGLNLNPSPKPKVKYPIWTEAEVRIIKSRIKDALQVEFQDILLILKNSAWP